MKQPPTPIRVLVVDDDAMSRELLGVLLEGEGYVVESADSGAAALAVLAQGGTAPDLVLADVQMPGTTGSRLAGRLRHACPPATLLLAMSGSQPPAKTISRFYGFLLKPFTMNQVAAILSTAGRRPVAKKESRAAVSAASRASASRPGIAASDPPKSQTASNNRMGRQEKELRSSPGGKAAGSRGSDVLDEKIYQRLADSMPARQLQEMYKLCVQDARKRIAHMRALMAEHDAAPFVSEAHAIKGSCGMLGATQLYAIAAELEQNGLQAAVAEATPDVNSLDELLIACDRLERMLGSRI